VERHSLVIFRTALLLAAAVVTAGAEPADPPQPKAPTLGKAKASVAKSSAMTSVSADHIRLQVPVQLSHMILPADKVPTVACTVNAFHHAVGYKRVPVPLSAAGSYNGTVTVDVTAREGQALGDAQSYVCTLGIGKKEGGSANWSPGPKASYPWGRPKQGAPFEWQVKGSIQP
jgi:hypothetical protein